jgi:hypothetical protein
MTPFQVGVQRRQPRAEEPSSERALGHKSVRTPEIYLYTKSAVRMDAMRKF